MTDDAPISGGEAPEDWSPPSARTAMALAFSWLTVLPVRGPESINRRAGAGAIAAVPLTGLVLGFVAAGVAGLIHLGGGPSLLAGIAVVATLALGSRGMHADGLADTVDGLGCYGPAQRAREVMRSGSVGPMGAAALVIVLVAQAAAFADLTGWCLVMVPVAVLVSRVAAVVVCRRGATPAEGSGFGALIVGTQGPLAVGGWSAFAVVVAAVAAAGLASGAGTAGPVLDLGFWSVSVARVITAGAGALVATAALAVPAVLARHCERRFGGCSGDVVGASIETSLLVAAAGFALLPLLS